MDNKFLDLFQEPQMKPGDRIKFLPDSPDSPSTLSMLTGGVVFRRVGKNPGQFFIFKPIQGEERRVWMGHIVPVARTEEGWREIRERWVPNPLVWGDEIEIVSVLRSRWDSLPEFKTPIELDARPFLHRNL